MTYTRMLRRLLPLLALALSGRALGQTYFNQQHPLEPAGYVGGSAVLPTDSGYVVVGFGTAGSPYARHLVVAYFDALGQPVRHRLFAHRAGPDLYGCQSGPLQRLPDGGFAMAGSVGLTGTVSHGQLWRFAPGGDTLWTRTYPPTDSGLFVRLAQHTRVPADGGFALIGDQRRPPRTREATDLLLIRTDRAGRERWRRRFRQPGHEYHLGWQVVAAPDGGFVLCAYSAPTTAVPLGRPFNGDGLVIKTDSVGQEQWRYTFATPFFDAAAAAVCLPGGGYLIGGQWGAHYLPPTNSACRALLVRLDAQGRELWRRTYGPARFGAETRGLYLLADGTAVLAGVTTDPPARPGTLAVVASAVRVCAATGDSLWRRTYRYFSGPNTQHYLRDFAPTPDGGFVGTGFIHLAPPDVGPQSVWPYKTDAKGYVEAGGAPPPAVACAPLGVAPATEPEAGRVAVWPNPSATGRFTLRAPAGAAYTVLDATGRRVAAGRLRGPETELDLSGLPAGVYALRLTGPDGRSLTRRIVRQ
ncbi:MAG: T9SS type A sorting domain-containing protein [Hymenobacteraceae bacterium]|nr:T9SS type A sorting domain-containing protein [Hymenobacteraceae bacterium]